MCCSTYIWTLAKFASSSHPLTCRSTNSLIVQSANHVLCLTSWACHFSVHWGSPIWGLIHRGYDWASLVILLIVQLKLIGSSKHCTECGRICSRAFASHLDVFWFLSLEQWSVKSTTKPWQYFIITNICEAYLAWIFVSPLWITGSACLLQFLSHFPFFCPLFYVIHGSAVGKGIISRISNRIWSISPLGHWFESTLLSVVIENHCHLIAFRWPIWHELVVPA